MRFSNGESERLLLFVVFGFTTLNLGAFCKVSVQIVEELECVDEALEVLDLVQVVDGTVHADEHAFGLLVVEAAHSHVGLLSSPVTFETGRND